MTKHLTLLLILSVGYSQQEYHLNDLLTINNGLFTEKFSNEPITGKVYGYFGENNKKVYIGNVRNGKEEGNWIWWYHNGQKSYEGTFKDGERQGLHTSWYHNGQKENEVIFKDGEVIKLIGKWNEDSSLRE